MSIPDCQTIIQPLLRFLSDRKEHSLKDVVAALGREFQLSEEEIHEVLPSGQSLLFASRVSWAKIHLKKAGLIDSPRRGQISISSKGMTLLNKRLSEASRQENEIEAESVQTERQTPAETIDAAYKKIRQSLAQELIDTVRRLSPAFFERLVVELLVKMGYGGSIEDAGKAIGRAGDEGIDGTIKEDKLGLDIIYVQAKRWNIDNVVGRPELHKFVGALAGQGAKKGIFITTSTFTKEALNYSPKIEAKIVLIDGLQLAQLMIDYNLGVSIQHAYEIKRLDSDYFDAA